jgi:hypothetical protein
VSWWFVLVDYWCDLFTQHYFDLQTALSLFKSRVVGVSSFLVASISLISEVITDHCLPVVGLV